MAWIESHQELRDNPKTRKLSRLLGVNVPTVIGHLQCLWWWATDYAQDGELSKYDDEDIADAMMWDKEPKELIEALVKVRFLDEDETGRRIHDWWEYAGKLIDRREKDRERKRNASISRSNSVGVPTENKKNDKGTLKASDVTVQNSTEQYRTVQNSTEQKSTTPRKRVSKKAQETNPKTQYAEFVSMTNDEYTSLVTKVGEHGAIRCIEILDNYKGANGKKYNSDYRAILNWVITRYNEEQAQVSPNQAPQSSSKPNKNGVNTMSVLDSIIDEEV